MPFPTSGQWDDARLLTRERYASEFADLEALHVAVDAALGGGEAKPQYTAVEDAVLGHLARATSVALDVRFLCELARVEGALALTRILAECLASLVYLLVDPDERDARAAAFADFHLVEMRAERKLADQVGWNAWATTLNRHIIAAEKDSRPAAVFDYPLLGWTQLNPDKLDRAIAGYWAPSKRSVVRRYLQIARHWGNGQLHIGPAETLDYLHNDDAGNRTFTTGGDLERTPQALALAIGLYSEILRVAGAALGLPSLTRVETPPRDGPRGVSARPSPDNPSEASEGSETSLD